LKKKAKASQENLVLHGIKITHASRIAFEEGKITKGDVARYYAAVAPLLLQEIKNRPISLLRCPSGVNAECFYQRNVGFGLGPDVLPFQWDYKGSSYKYIYVKDEKGLMEIIQMGVIEIHPWGATVDKVHTPDRMIFDLDPDPSVPFAEVKKAALEIKKRLKKQGLESFLKCTGGKGLHIVVRLASKADWNEVKTWAAEFSREMVKDAPDKYVATITKSKRVGKILIDYFRNDYTATGIASYSLRARLGAPVAVPLKWSELARLKSANQFGMADVLKRIKNPKTQKSDTRGQKLPEAKLRGRRNMGVKKDLFPMEALLVSQLPEGKEWRYEPKWDGFRCLAYRGGRP
jgi:bifunctional non-homologous end joining protein LigD